MSTSFSSEGFDLDALPTSSSGNTEDVIFEVGGSANAPSEPPNDESPIASSEKLKEEGNEAFKSNNYLDACDMYTSAIECCPGMTGLEILTLQDEYEAQESEKQLERHRLEMEARRKEHPASLDKQEKSLDELPPSLRPGDFKVPPHPHGHNLAIYHCNRAACMMHLENYEDSVKDCNIAILLRPDWGKAFVRRSAAFEKLGKSELALVRRRRQEQRNNMPLIIFSPRILMHCFLLNTQSDAGKALELDPQNPAVKKSFARLQKIENERLEKLKEGKSATRTFCVGYEPAQLIVFQHASLRFLRFIYLTEHHYSFACRAPKKLWAN